MCHAIRSLEVVIPSIAASANGDRAKPDLEDIDEGTTIGLTDNDANSDDLVSPVRGARIKMKLAMG